MYVQKEPVRGYNEYLNLNEGEGIKAMMDVGLLVMEAGDTYSFHETEKEMAWIMFEGKAKWNTTEKPLKWIVPTPLITIPTACIFAPETAVPSQRMTAVYSTYRKP